MKNVISFALILASFAMDCFAQSSRILTARIDKIEGNVVMVVPFKGTPGVNDKKLVVDPASVIVSFKKEDTIVDAAFKDLRPGQLANILLDVPDGTNALRFTVATPKKKETDSPTAPEVPQSSQNPN